MTHAKSMWRAILGVAVILMMVLSGLVLISPSEAKADDGAGAAGVGGTGGANGSGWDARWWAWGDRASDMTWTSNAVNSMLGWSQWGTTAKSTLKDIFGTTSTGLCGKAVDNAQAKYGGLNSDYRIVMVGTFLGNNQAGSGKFPYQGSPGVNFLYDSLNAAWSKGSLQKNLKAATVDREGYLETVKTIANDTVKGKSAPNACIVLKKNQPDPSYSLNITTRKSVGLVGEATPTTWGTQTVRDRIKATHTPAGGLCGAQTSKGGSCQRRGFCPYHA